MAGGGQLVSGPPPSEKQAAGFPPRVTPGAGDQPHHVR